MYRFLSSLLGAGVICQPSGEFIVLAEGGRMGIELRGYTSRPSARLAQAVEVLL